MKSILIIFLILALTVSGLKAQVTPSGSDLFTSAVPFLTINPGAAASGMGETGVATLPDLFSQHNNSAKFPFMDNKTGVGFSFPFYGVLSPGWLSSVARNYRLMYLSGFQKLDDNNCLSLSVRYSAPGDSSIFNDLGEIIIKRSPEEFAFDFGYSFRFSESLSGAVTLRSIRSDISGMKTVGLHPVMSGFALASDLSLYYYFKKPRSRFLDDVYTAGIILQNVGSRIAYEQNVAGNFLPTLLKLGAGYTWNFSVKNYLHISAEVSRWMVPAPVSGNLLHDSTGVYGGTGLVADKTVVGGMISSFTDAPGGLSGELKEVMISVGTEYKMMDWMKIRSGFFYENRDWGNRRYFTFGTGLLFKQIGMDLSWLVPVRKDHPLSGTRKISLVFLL